MVTKQLKKLYTLWLCLAVVLPGLGLFGEMSGTGERLPFVSQPQDLTLFDQRFGDALLGVFGRFSAYLFILGANWILGNASSGGERSV